MKISTLAMGVTPLFHSMLFTQAHAETLGDDVTKNPMALIVYLKAKKQIQPEFYYCLSDIEKFENYNSKFCLYTVSSFNIYLDDLSIGKIPYGRSSILLTVLNLLPKSNVIEMCGVCR